MTSIGRILLSDNTSNHSQIIVVKANCLNFMWRKTLARIWGTYERCAGVVATQPSRQNLVITVAKRSIGTEGGRCRRRRQTWHECLIVEWTWRCQVSVGWSSNPEWRRTYLYPDRTASLRVPKIPSRQRGPSRRQKNKALLLLLLLGSLGEMRKLLRQLRMLCGDSSVLTDFQWKRKFYFYVNKLKISF